MRPSALTGAILAMSLAVGVPVSAEDSMAGHIAILPEAVKWTPGPPSLPAGAKGAVLEGDPTKPGLFTMRIQLPANYLISPHRHPEAERVTVLDGSVYVGFGEKVDRKRSTHFRAGSFYVNPAGARAFRLDEGRRHRADHRCRPLAAQVRQSER